jgi:hypothetical protein
VKWRGFEYYTTLQSAIESGRNKPREGIVGWDHFPSVIDQLTNKRFEITPVTGWTRGFLFLSRQATAIGKGTTLVSSWNCVDFAAYRF